MLRIEEPADAHKDVFRAPRSLQNSPTPSFHPKPLDPRRSPAASAASSSRFNRPTLRHKKPRRATTPRAGAKRSHLDPRPTFMTHILPRHFPRFDTLFPHSYTAPLSFTETGGRTSFHARDLCAGILLPRSPTITIHRQQSG